MFVSIAYVKLSSVRDVTNYFRELIKIATTGHIDVG